MHRELMERRPWLSEERFLHALNFCMLMVIMGDLVGLCRFLLFN
jgi:hypothetical protein